MNVLADHSTIIQRAGGVTPLRKILAGAGHLLPDATIRSWRRLNSIPAPYWKALADSGVATLDELAAAVAKVIDRPTPDPANDNANRPEAPEVRRAEGP